MIKSIVKGTSLLVTGVAVGGLLTYNSRMVEIKAGVDDIKTSAITSIGENKTLNQQITEKNNKIKELEERIKEQAQNDHNNLVEYNKLLKQYREKVKELEALKASSVNKEEANAQIQKANNEEDQVLEYINNAKTEIENAKK